MSTYITLHKLQIQNANCVAGLTYGFPAITQFLGYIHALSLKLQASHQLKLEGCAVICHQHQIHAYQPKGKGEYVLAQTRNPLTRIGEVAPIMEEGKMHLTVSLVTHCEGMIGGEFEVSALRSHLNNLCLTQKMAGGVINRLDNIFIDICNTEDDQQHFNWKMRRRLLPGFMLLNQASYLKEYFIESQRVSPDVTLIDAWMDFFALKYKATPKLKEGEEMNESTEAEWKYVQKPRQGYLVPLMVGYKAVSEEIPAGTLMSARDTNIPFNFVEAAYGVGEWVSPHRLKNIDDAMWFYQSEPGWFLCGHAEQLKEDIEDEDEDEYWGFL